MTNLDIQQEIYESMKDGQDAKNFCVCMHEGIKHEYTGTLDELRQQVKLGFLKWINEL